MKVAGYVVNRLYMVNLFWKTYSVCSQDIGCTEDKHSNLSSFPCQGPESHHPHLLRISQWPVGKPVMGERGSEEGGLTLLAAANRKNEMPFKLFAASLIWFACQPGQGGKREGEERTGHSIRFPQIDGWTD